MEVILSGAGHYISGITWPVSATYINSKKDGGKGFMLLTAT
jgi:hypothetical protein